jgi:hypothetical protein
MSIYKNLQIPYIYIIYEKSIREPLQNFNNLQDSKNTSGVSK